jgi:hypothetical protein
VPGLLVGTSEATGPVGVWSDGEIIWVADQVGAICSYRLTGACANEPAPVFDGPTGVAEPAGPPAVRPSIRLL